MIRDTGVTSTYKTKLHASSFPPYALCRDSVCTLVIESRECQAPSIIARCQAEHTTSCLERCRLLLIITTTLIIFTSSESQSSFFTHHHVILLLLLLTSLPLLLLSNTTNIIVPTSALLRFPLLYYFSCHLRIKCCLASRHWKPLTIHILPLETRDLLKCSLYIPFRVI